MVYIVYKHISRQFNAPVTAKTTAMATMTAIRNFMVDFSTLAPRKY